MDIKTGYSQGHLHELNAAREAAPTLAGRPKAQSVFDAELAAEAIKRTDKLNDSSIDLAIRLKQARDFMDWSANHMKTAWLDWMDEANKASRHVNELRMAFDRESKSIVASGKDVEQFFNSSEYREAHARLKEMVDLLDRFSTLKNNGTLDAFADFILKVSCK